LGGLLMLWDFGRRHDGNRSLCRNSTRPFDSIENFRLPFKVCSVTCVFSGAIPVAPRSCTFRSVVRRTPFSLRNKHFPFKRHSATPGFPEYFNSAVWPPGKRSRELELLLSVWGRKFHSSPCSARRTPA